LRFQKRAISGGYKGSEGSRGGSEALKLKGFNLKVKLKLKLKCLRGVPEGGISEGGVPEGGVVFDRFLRVRDRRFG
jgi:hypothetical protein